jgi:hypothetical protein
MKSGVGGVGTCFPKSRRQKGDTKQLHTKDPQIFRATLQNVVAKATCRPGFVHPCIKYTTGAFDHPLGAEIEHS